MVGGGGFGLKVEAVVGACGGGASSLERKVKAQAKLVAPGWWALRSALNTHLCSGLSSECRVAHTHLQGWAVSSCVLVAPRGE